MSEPNDDDLFKGPTLDADGKLENRFAKVESPAPATDEPLELAERAPKVVEERVEQFREVPRQRRSGALMVVVGALVLGLAALAGFMVFKPSLPVPDGVHEVPLLRELLGPRELPPLIISSEPSGATISVDGTVLGQTPWAGENRWVGEPKVVLQLNGFRAWEGKLTGGKAQTLDVRLKK